MFVTNQASIFFERGQRTSPPYPSYLENSLAWETDPASAIGNCEKHVKKLTDDRRRNFLSSILPSTVTIIVPCPQYLGLQSPLEIFEIILFTRYHGLNQSKWSKLNGTTSACTMTAIFAIGTITSPRFRLLPSGYM